MCKCGFCGAEKQALSEWERHTGSKSRNWRTSVKVKGSLLPLEQWVCTILSDFFVFPPFNCMSMLSPFGNLGHNLMAISFDFADAAVSRVS